MDEATALAMLNEMDHEFVLVAGTLANLSPNSTTAGIAPADRLRLRQLLALAALDVQQLATLAEELRAAANKSRPTKLALQALLDHSAAVPRHVSDAEARGFSVRKALGIDAGTLLKLLQLPPHI